MDRRRLTGRYATCLTVLLLAAGWIADPGHWGQEAKTLMPAAQPGVTEPGLGVVNIILILLALLAAALLVLLVDCCERSPARAGRLLRSRSWAPFVLSFPYFFLLVLASGVVIELLLRTPISSLFRPLAGFVHANWFLMWCLFFSLVALFGLPAVERWLRQRYP